ncbi:DUF2922 domain-containing protein [Vagococcus intermedius]|uniref:DUF2922 domain-containing protein n=1 Tax=Vagococcus intermedius TaxID=2991418 RepID=A0AAF0CVK8_9ENTE|nr:DUF2922 domain-containing protein [Vagococcus intermedius]WEG73803.1 DUF2922 domain-containing protein [Vagococcus intermedius]WEG75888.1 DUF2922 domain-containing protein [Vagococcus intermedius]
MKKLSLNFLDAAGKPVTLTPRLADSSLSAEQVKYFMEQLIQLELFERNSVLKYSQIASAKYIETLTTDLF